KRPNMWCRDRSRSSSLHRPELGKRDLVAHSLERHLDVETDRQPIEGTVDDVRQHPAAVLELDQHDGIGNLGGESGVVDLMHDVEADHLAPPGRRDPPGLAAETFTADRSRRKAAPTAALAGFDDEPFLARRGEERREMIGYVR